MKKVLLTLLAVIVVIGALAGAGYTGYRIGYRQGEVLVNSNTTRNNSPDVHGLPFMHPDIPMRNFERGLGQNFSRSDRMRGGMGFGFFAPLMFLGRILFWGLIIWFIYWLFTKSGWQLTRKSQPAESPKVDATIPEEKKA